MVKKDEPSPFLPMTTEELVEWNQNPHSSYQRWQGESNGERWHLFPKLNPHTGKEWDPINCIPINLSEDALYELTSVSTFGLTFIINSA